MSKKQNAEIIVENFKFPNFGIGYWEGNAVEIKNSLPGQKCLVEIHKKRRKYEGKVLEVLEKAPDEIPPLCKNSGNCGGCTFQALEYDKELEIKKKMILKLIEEANIKLDFVPEIYPAPNPYRYRNKMEFSFGDEYKDGPLNLGLRKSGNYYEVCEGEVCNICDEDFNKIVEFSKKYFRESGDKFYHRMKKEGVLRHICVRKGARSGEILVNLVTAADYHRDLSGFVEGLSNLSLTGKITGILHTLNESVADVIKADELRILQGRDYFYDSLCGLNFKIYPFSFFQTNTEGAEKLYETVGEFAGNTADKSIFDLYCGTGTIAQILSKGAKKVYGIEIVESAVAAAKENARANNIGNCEFITGDVLFEINSLTEKPDIMVLDPPREGIHPKAITPLIEFAAEKIVYVSCKPTSLMRDLNVFLENGYSIADFRIHDMFARSYHVECVVLLTRKDG